MRRATLSLLAGILAVLWPALSGATAPITATVTRLDADHLPLVRLSLSVVGPDGDSLTGLTAKELSLTEDGAAVPAVEVRSLLPGQERVAVALVLDRSSSMRGRPLAAAQQAVKEFADRLSESDAVTLVSFGTRPDPGRDPATDRAAFLADLAGVRSGGETALYDAMGSAIPLLAGCAADRKAVVALTDGWDSSSRRSAAQIAASAQAAGVVIYGIALGGSTHPEPLQALADGTGGALYRAATPEELVDLYRKIAARLQNEYLLSYTSPAPSGRASWHTVVVSVRDRGGVGTTQRQYLAVPPGGAGSPGAEWLRVAVPAAVAVNVVLMLALAVRARQRRASAR